MGTNRIGMGTTGEVTDETPRIIEPEALAAARGRLEAYCADHTHDGYSNMHTGRLYAGYCPNGQPNVSFDVAVENFLADIRTVLSSTARDRRVDELEQEIELTVPIRFSPMTTTGRGA